MVKESDGARVIFIEGQTIPLIVVKRDGGYNYASTDLAALWLAFLISNQILSVAPFDQLVLPHFDLLFTGQCNWDFI